MRILPVLSLVVALLVAVAPAAQAASPYRSIDGSKVNLRAGPGKDHKRLFVVSQGYPVRVVERRNGWAEVEDYEGDRGWVFADLLSDRRTVVVIKPLVNVRKGPSTDREVAFKAERNVLLRYLGAKGKWVHVRHADGDEGWVYAPLVWGD
ncbi:MAG TPA: SH3 domain-containing protein [Gammaproteobacteria bacterium]|nr:SH3 domain-containing protein [Gammaproteobacteria bacterium]